MGRYGTPDSWKAIPWMFPAGNHPCNNTFIIIFVVVYNIGISQLSYFIPGWKMVRQPFLIRLGSKGALWWHTLFEKKEILRLDEMVYEKIIAAFRMGGLESKYRIGNSHMPYRITLWSDLFPQKSMYHTPPFPAKQCKEMETWICRLWRSRYCFVV